jgi:hypothetical protein
LFRSSSGGAGKEGESGKSRAGGGSGERDPHPTLRIARRVPALRQAAKRKRPIEISLLTAAVG